MTFDTVVEYIDENYDPSDYPDYNSFIEDIVQGWKESNNPDLIFRNDIQEGLFDLYQYEFGLQEPESFETITKEFSEV